MGTFWLQVKESYIIENFSALVKYLCNYVAPVGADDPDFDATYTCLKNVAHEHCDKARRCINLFEQHNPNSELDLTTLVKVASASILTAHKLKHDEDYSLMLNLVNILLLHKSTSSAKNCTDMLDFVKACIEHRPVERLGLTWHSLECSLDIITEHLLNTQWGNRQEGAPIYYFEHNGLAIVDNNSLTISTQNLDTWSKGKLQNVMPIPYNISVQSVATDRLKASATPLDAIAKTTELLTEISQFKPSTAKVRHDCVKGMTTSVKIIRKQFNTITARTVDPRFNTVEGRVFINSYQMAQNTLISRDELYQQLNVDDYLLVRYIHTSKAEFEIDLAIYNDFYADEAQLICDAEAEAEAMFITEFNGGTRWLSSHGLLLNVSEAKLTDDDREELNAAIDGNLAVTLRIKDVFTNENGNSVINAIFCPKGTTELNPPVNTPEFRREAMLSLIDDFCGFCQAEFEALPAESNQLKIDDIIGLVVASRILYKFSALQDTTMDRVKVLAAAILLAECCGDEMTSDKAFMQHEMKFLECGVKFVRGECSPATLALPYVATLEGVADVQHREQVVKSLSTYKQDDQLTDTEQTAYDANEAGSITVATIEKISKLVEASNILLGKIQPQSLARIKAEIATCLELDDEYIPKVIDNDQTYYGVESDTIEFKSSIVFPPCNRQINSLTADPENQKWAIVKTICGFLNSHNGGELYLGVRDNGYACVGGIRNDIDALFNLGKISIKGYDSYRRYVKNILDSAFQSYDKKYHDTDITAEIIYDYIKDKEEQEIMRIHVNPFKHDAVRITLPQRPEWISDAYVRTSGATVPLSEVKRQEISERRRSSK
jgi:hypothetical protein